MKYYTYYIYLLAEQHGNSRNGKIGITRQNKLKDRIRTIQWNYNRKYSVVEYKKLKLTKSDAEYIESTIRKMLEHNGYEIIKNDHFITSYNKLVQFNGKTLKIFNKAIIKALNELQQDDEWAI